VGIDRCSPQPLRIDPAWAQRGYVWAEATVDSTTFGSDEIFCHDLLRRRDRAAVAASTSPWLRIEAERKSAHGFER